MRMFTFQPFHLSSIQQSIQSCHAVVELLMKYPRSKTVKQWAIKDKTLIVKNGGDSAEINEIIKLFKHKNNPFPWSYFREPDLENVITSVAICLPDHIYRGKIPGNEFEEKLISLLKRTKLAT